MVLITFTRALVFPLQLHSFSAKCQPRSGRGEKKSGFKQNRCVSTTAG